MDLRLALCSILIYSHFSIASGRTAKEWGSRRIYQIVTDRFAKSQDDINPCTDLSNYCGGTWKGIERNLDYIQGMGFNAIWISPVQKNIPGGYHGYWYSDFYQLNENFGTEQDFIDLIQACHQRDIWVMGDIVVNHIGYVQSEIEETGSNDYSKSVPFNKVEYFHPFEMTCIDARKNHAENKTAVETCWLAYLPDLNQTHPFVRQTLLEWISWFVKTYKIDGLRIDAIIHVPIDFWIEFEKAAQVFCVGEAFDERVSYNAQYQKAVGSMLNFPLNAKLYYSFIKNESMTNFAEYYKEAHSTWPDISVVINFMNSHDIPRFLYQSNDIEGFKAAIAFTLTSIGIPALYYGDEQAFRGGPDPQNRESLWGNMNRESEIYQFVKSLNDFRSKTNLHNLNQIERDYDDKFYSFTRGIYFFGFTNSHEAISRVIDNHPYEEGEMLCNFFDMADCKKVQGGTFNIEIFKKQVVILVPATKLQKETPSLQGVKEGIQTTLKSGTNALSILFKTDHSMSLSK